MQSLFQPNCTYLCRKLIRYSGKHISAAVDDADIDVDVDDNGDEIDDFDDDNYDDVTVHFH